MTKEFWHEFTSAQQKKLKKKTWRYVKKHYKQPDWCKHPDAIHPLGCWSLLDRSNPGGIKITEKYCKDCDDYRRVEGANYGRNKN